MDDLNHVIRIVAHLVQAFAALAFLFLMWKWSRPEKKCTPPREQVEAAERCLSLRNKLEKEHLESVINNGYYR